MKSVPMTLVVPPQDLRARVGPFSDAGLFVASGRQTVERAQRLTGLSSSSHVLDIGCGCGRVALPLADTLHEGIYVGLDPDIDHITWCNEEIASRDPRFSFYHLDIDVPPYNAGGRVRVEELQFPVPGPFDVVILSSVLTHMAPAAIEHYLRELPCLLKSDGQCLVSALLIDDKARKAIAEGKTDFRFTHFLGSGCWTFDADNPSEGVAMETEWFFEALEANGLAMGQLEYGTWRDVKGVEIEHDWMSVLRAR
jgi:SAM-dependent methyltransferase